MKLLAITILGLALASPAYAQDSNANAGSAADSAADAAAVNQGVLQNIAFNSPDQQRVNYDGKIGNTPVMLTAATSFSSDYCGGTASGGLSGGAWTFGIAKITFDEHCQHLRAAEKWGLATVTLRNLGYREAERSAVSMMLYELCLANESSTQGCLAMGLVQSQDLPKAPDTIKPIVFKTWPQENAIATPDNR